MLEVFVAAALGGAAVYGFRRLRDRRLAQGYEPLPSGILLPEMRIACTAVSEAMCAMRDAALPGATTAELEEVAIRSATRIAGVTPYFRDYLAFPNFITASVNNEVIGTRPSTRHLQEGDLLKVQFGNCFDRAFAYQAWTFEIGSLRFRPILESLEATLVAAINVARPGSKVRVVSAELEDGIRRIGWHPSAHYVGHRIGSLPRSSPAVACRRSRDPGQHAFLQEGMLLSVFLLAHRRVPHLRVRPDGWNVIDVNEEPSIMLSHVIRVTPDGGEVLTQSCGRRA